MHAVGNLEGVEIIAEFYKRNLAIYSNSYEVPKKKTDCVLIILGGVHSAFLDVFLKNDTNFELADPKEYVAH